MTDTTLATAGGWSSVSLGLLTLLSSLIILIIISKQSYVRFLRIMTVIIAVTSTMEMLNGIILLRFHKEEDSFKKAYTNLFILVYAFANSSYNIGMFSIIWFVSFKYWETSR